MIKTDTDKLLLEKMKQYKDILDEKKKLLEKKNEAKAKVRGYEEKNKLLYFNRSGFGHLGRYGTWENNSAQKEYFGVLKNPLYKIFTLTGANRISKCVTKDTVIETPSGDKLMIDLYKAGKAFDVYAWDGKKRVIAKADVPFKKEGLHECYRIEMSDGRFIEAADDHRILTSFGWMYVSDLSDIYSPYGEIPLESSLESYLSARVLSVEHLMEKVSGFLVNCYEHRHQCDEQPQILEGIFRFFSPLQACVLRQFFVSLRLDDQDSKCANNVQPTDVLLSIQDVLRQIEALFFVSLNQVVCKLDKQYSHQYLAFLQLSVAAFSRLQQDVLFSILPHVESLPSYHPPLLPTSSNSIISINAIGVKECYDFTVHEHHNYFAAGLVNHNTMSTTGVTTLLALRGRFPWEDENKGHWFWDIHGWKPPIKIRIVGQDWEKHIKTVIVPTLKEMVPQSWDFAQKKNNVGVEHSWTDPATGGSIEIMSNKSESDLFEGWSGHMIIYDEPPKRNNRIACARGLIDYNGIEIFAMTLLKEAWVDREVINAVTEDGLPDPSVYNIHADISVNVGHGLSQEGVEQFEKALSEEEKDARLRGIPSYKSGLVLKFERKHHIKERFEIPCHWVVDVAIDIGVAKPHDVTFLAIAPNNFKYLIFAYQIKGDGTAIADSIIKKQKTYNLRMNRIIVDPLAKADQNNENSTYEKIDMQLQRFGYYLETGTKDKDDGIIGINNYLWTVNLMPALFVFRDCPRAILQLESWMYDDQGKPQKKDDDQCENLYRLMLLDTVYEEPQDRDAVYETTSSNTRNSFTGY